MIRHGGCLGLGLASMGLGTARPEVYEVLKNNLYQDDAVTGEAAGIAMGLTMLGSMDASVIHDMRTYARETQHEKILRGLALGISMLCFGRLESADGLIQELLEDKVFPSNQGKYFSRNSMTLTFVNDTLLLPIGLSSSTCRGIIGCNGLLWHRCKLCHTKTSEGSRF